MKKIFIILLLPLFLSSCLTKMIRESSTSKIFQANYRLSEDNIYNNFFWANNKEAIFIPVKIDNYPDTVYFQLDLGSGITILYEKQISIMMQDSLIRNKIKKGTYRYSYIKPKIWLNDNEYLNCTHIPIYNNNNTEGFSIENDSIARSYVRPKNDFFIIGTLGYDLILNKTIIIDFKNSKYCLTESVNDSSLTVKSNKIKASVYAWPAIIKTKYRNKRKKFIYDTGSSRFGLVLFEKEWLKSDGYQIDTLDGVFGMVKELFTVQKITNEKLLLNSMSFSDFPIITSEAIEDNKFGLNILRVKGIIGNYLFYDKVIIIDSKNNKMWIK